MSTVTAESDDAQGADLASSDAAADTPDAATTSEGVLPPRLRLIALTFLMLFTELALIRWLGARVVYMSYYSNFVLLASFLGFGLGFLWAGCRKTSIYRFGPVLLGALVGFVALFEVPLKATTKDIVFFERVETEGVLPRWVVLLVLFVAVAAAGTCIGDGVARTFGRFKPLEAYKLDLVGSVLGIAGFTLLSFLGARPLIWGLIIGALFLLTLPVGRNLTTLMAGIGIALMLLPFITEMTDREVVWSPYYRITYEDHPSGGISAEVNQSPHWTQVGAGNPMYQHIFDTVGPAGQTGDVLVIGAGSGNDVAMALDQGATHVDAVEIDGRLMELAEENHPDQPYDDPRVDIHIDDGRAFLERADKKWDRILLALPDSLALVQGQSAIRLESYLFTEEAVEAAQDHLKPGGVFAMYNWYREDWLVGRYANTLSDVFEQPPCVNRSEDLANLSVLVASDDPASLNCPEDEVWQDRDDVTSVQDDRPFPYVRSGSIPTDYLWTGLGALALTLLALVVIVGPTSQARSSLRYLDLFFMGVAFLLLETKSVTQFALLFGTTWLVNSLVFMGVLGSVLIAVAVSRRVTFRKPTRLYIVLLGALALAYVIPQTSLLQLPVVPRFFAAVTLAFFPIFTANLVFTQRFKDTASSTVAFGANLLGSMVGGLIEYASLITGFRNLLIVVAVAYGLAFLVGRKHLTAGAEALAAKA